MQQTDVLISVFCRLSSVICFQEPIYNKRIMTKFESVLFEPIRKEKENEIC